MLNTHHPHVKLAESLNGSLFLSRLAAAPPRCGGDRARRAPLVKKNSPDTPAHCRIQKFRKTRVLLSNSPTSYARHSALGLVGYPPTLQITFAKSVFCVNFCAHRVRQQTRTLNLIRLRGAAVSASRPPFACCLRLVLNHFPCRRIKTKPRAVFFHSRRFIFIRIRDRKNKNQGL